MSDLPLYCTAAWCFLHAFPSSTACFPCALGAQLLTRGADHPTEEKKMLRYLKYPSQPTPRSANVVTAIALPNAAR
jgi:hypothetical protein